MLSKKLLYDIFLLQPLYWRQFQCYRKLDDQFNRHRSLSFFVLCVSKLPSHINQSFLAPKHFLHWQFVNLNTHSKAFSYIWYIYIFIFIFIYLCLYLYIYLYLFLILIFIFIFLYVYIYIYICKVSVGILSMKIFVLRLWVIAKIKKKKKLSDI